MTIPKYEEVNSILTHFIILKRYKIDIKFNNFTLYCCYAQVLTIHQHQQLIVAYQPTLSQKFFFAMVSPGANTACSRFPTINLSILASLRCYSSFITTLQARYTALYTLNNQHIIHGESNFRLSRLVRQYKLL